MTHLPDSSREVRLTATPDGLPRPEHFAVVVAPMPVPGAGEVLVRNRYFQVFAALRTLIGAGAGDAPLAALRPGDALWGTALGEVVAAPAESGVRPGELVTHLYGWREYAAVPAAACSPVHDVLPDPAAHLSQAWTSHAALTRGVRLRPGDTVFVSGAAGAVGTMAGQIARRLGAGRVLGSTGSAEKAERLRTALGYDAVIVRGARTVADQLAAAAPDGIDVLVDTVGGEQLQASVAAARPDARFVLIGALSGQLAPEGSGGAAPVELDSFQLIVKRITMRGFTAAVGAQADQDGRVGDWLRSGEIAFPHTRVAGIDDAVPAFHDMMNGRHLGAVIVEL